MGGNLSCVKCVDDSDSVENLTLHKKEKGKRKSKTIKISSSQDQTSQLITRQAEVLSVAEESVNAKLSTTAAPVQDVADSSVDVPQDSVSTTSTDCDEDDWSIDVPQIPVCVGRCRYQIFRPHIPVSTTEPPVQDVADFRVDDPQDSESTTSTDCDEDDWSIDVPQIPVCVGRCRYQIFRPHIPVSTTEPPVQDVADFRVDDPQDSESTTSTDCDEDDWSIDVPQIPVCVGRCRYQIFRPHIPVSTTEPPVQDVAESRVDDPQDSESTTSTDCDEDDCFIDVPQIPVCVGRCRYQIFRPHIPVSTTAAPVRDVEVSSVDVPQDPVSTTTAPVQDVADSSVDVPQDPESTTSTDCDEDDWSIDVPQIPVCVGQCRYQIFRPHIPVSTKEAPVQDVADSSVGVPQDPESTTSTDCDEDDCSIDVPQIPVCVGQCRYQIFRPHITVSTRDSDRVLIAAVH